MADDKKEPTKVVVQQPAVFKFDAERCKAHIASVRESVGKFVGKRNCNPFLFFGSRVDPLEFRLQKGEMSKELQDDILSVDKNSIPWVPGFTATPEDVAAARK